MRRMWLGIVMALAAAMVARGQIGKTVEVPAGSPEDAALSEIYAAQDPAQKIGLLDKFAVDHPSGDFALLADQLYSSAYLAEKNYEKAFEYGEKALAIDPDNFASVVILVHAAQDAGDTTKLFHYGELASGILARYKASPAPAETTAADWEAKKADVLKQVQPEAQYVEYSLYSAALKDTDPAAKAKLLVRYLAAFPDSPYTENVEIETILAYQAAREDSKAAAAAAKAVKDYPNSAGVLVTVADYWSDHNEQLAAAKTYAQKALTLLPTEAKPEGVTEEQWQQQTSLQKGIALSALGQVYVSQGNNAAAIEVFQQASPLLKSDNFSYGRNLYRWGFTLAHMRRTLEARRILTQAVDTKSAYSSFAEQTLSKIGGPVRTSGRH